MSDVGQTLLVVIPIVIAALSLAYLATFGQRSISEHRGLKRAKQLEQQSAASIPRPPVMENLPSPDYPHFVGRESEQARLRQLLLPYPESQHAVVAIDGIGGSGKSALALHVAREYVRTYDTLPQAHRFEAIVWTSAKEEFLSATGTEVRPWRDRTLDDILRTIAACLGRQDITRARAEDRVELARNALKQQRTLLILDNMDTIDDESVHAFLRELPAPTKAIVTTRTRIDVAMTIQLSGMDPAQAREVLTGQLGDESANLDAVATSDLIDRSGGLPLALVWAAARMRLGDSMGDVLADLEGDEDEALTEYAFGSIWTRLDEQTEHLPVLKAAALFPSPVTLTLICGALPVADQRRVRSTLNELTTLCLLSRQGDTWEVLPLVRTSTARRSQDATASAQILTRAARAMAGRLRSLIGDERVRSVGVDQYALIDPDADNLLYLIEWCCQTRTWSIARDLVSGLGYYLHARGLWSDAVRAWELGAVAAHESGDAATEARFRSYLGYMAFFMGELTKARFHHEQAQQLLDPDALGYQTASLLRLAGYLAREDGHTGEALELFRQALTIMEAVDNVHGICRITNDLAETEIGLGRLEAAQLYGREALSRADAAGELIERVRSLTILASAARRAKDTDQAAAFAQQAKVEALASGWWEDAARASLELARVVLVREPETARDLAQEALGYYSRIGSTRGVEEAKDFLEANQRRRRWRVLPSR